MKEGKSVKLNHQQQNGHISPFNFGKLLDPEASWDKDQLGDVLHWIRQVVGLICGFLWGAVPLVGTIWIVFTVSSHYKFSKDGAKLPNNYTMDLPPLSSFSSSSLLSLSQWSTISARHPLVYVFYFCFIFYIIHLIRRLRSNKNQSTVREPPKVPGAWPLLGHIDLLALPYDKFAAMADIYGPVYSIRMGTRETIILNDLEMVKECFTTHDKLFSNRPVNFGLEYAFDNDYSINHMPYGSLWRDMRKVAAISLFSNHPLEMQLPILTSELNVLFNQLYISSKKAAVSVDMVSWFKDLVFDVIMSVTIGINSDQQQQNGVFSKDMAKKYKKVMDEALGLMETTFAISDLIPFLEWYDKLTGVTTPLSNKAKEMESFQEIWLQEHRHRQSGITVDNNISDNQVLKPYMESMLSSAQKPQFVGLDPDSLIKGACQDILIGGYSTTTTALPWTLFFLMNNRHILNKARKELDENIGKERQVEESDLKRLPYIHAVLKETLRLYLPGVELSRFASEDCVVGGFHVKAGTKVIFNLWKLYRDPNSWPDPLEFKPERFLSGNINADLDFKGNHYEFIPFGAGRRRCPAITFATRLMHLALARLIHGFELNIPREDGTADISAGASIPLIDGRISHLQILISPRFGSEVYALST